MGDSVSGLLDDDDAAITEFMRWHWGKAGEGWSWPYA